MTAKSNPNISQLVGLELLESITTFIAERTTMKGDLTADADAPRIGIKVDGTFEGSIVIPSGGVVHIGPMGRVTGERIEADMIFIEGYADSLILARKGLEVTNSGSIKGEVQYHEMINLHNLAKIRASVNFKGSEDN